MSADATQEWRSLFGERGAVRFVDQSARSQITNLVEEALGYLVPFIAYHARQHFTPLTKTELFGYVDYEEDTRDLVLIVWVSLPSKMALAYWDMLVLAVEGWARSLPDYLAEIVTDRIDIEVRWESDAAA